MFLQSISTKQFAPETRLERWTDHVCQHFKGITIDSQPDVRAELMSCSLGDVTITLSKSQRASIKRWHREEPTAEINRRLLHLQHKGFSVASQRGRSAPVATGDLTFCMPDEPYGHELSDNNASLILDLPDVFLNLPADRTCEVVTRGNPASGLLHDFVVSLLSQRWTEAIEADEKAALQATVVGLVQRSFRQQHADRSAPFPQDDRKRVHAFIEANLGDSTLRTSKIAASLSLSVRAVQEIFASMATTPSAYIIERRLTLASELLTLQPDTSITIVAYEFGFSDTAHLCRLFKRRFGESPGRFSAARRKEQL